MADKDDTWMYASLAIILIIIAIIVWIMTQKKENYQGKYDENDYYWFDGDSGDDEDDEYDPIAPLRLVTPANNWDPSDPCENVPPGMGVAKKNPVTGRIEIIKCQ